MKHPSKRKRRQLAAPAPGTLARIEAKCDVILSDLRSLKRVLFYRTSDVDEVIERMHQSAKRLKEQAEKDALLLRDLFNRKSV